MVTVERLVVTVERLVVTVERLEKTDFQNCLKQDLQLSRDTLSVPSVTGARGTNSGHL